MSSGAHQRWEGRPAAAALLRGGVIAVPIAASVLTAALVSRVLPAHGGGLQALWWWLTITASATLTLWLVDRLARRLLPLATLLRLSLLFPDRAPSRYAIARVAGSTRDLERRLEQARNRGIDDEPTAAAATLIGLVVALGVHDRRTRGHAERVRVYTDMLAEELRLGAGDRDRLRWAALLHDMGKLAVPARLLNKAGGPTSDEWQVLRRHPAEGARLCAPLLPWLGEWGRAIIEHHEHVDGTGYPAALRGDRISRAARILAVCDAYEVMTAPRAYRRRPLGAVAAREELLRCAGTHFDPAMVRAFLNISLARLRLAMGPLSWLAQWPVLRRAPDLGPSAGWATASIGGATALTIGGIANSPRIEPPAAPPVEAVAAEAHAQRENPVPLRGRGTGAADGVNPSSAAPAPGVPAAPDERLASSRPPASPAARPGAASAMPASPRPEAAPISPAPPEPSTPVTALPLPPAGAAQLAEQMIHVVADVVDGSLESLAEAAEPLSEAVSEALGPAEVLVEPLGDLAVPEPGEALGW